MFVFLVTSVVKSTLLVQLRHAPTTYATVYSISVPVMLVLQYLCGIEIFDRLAGHYPNFERTGKIMVGSLAILGVTVSAGTQRIGVPTTWYGLREAAVLLDRYALFALFVALVLVAVIMPRIQSLPMPRHAGRAAMMMGFYVFGNTLSATLMVETGAAWRLPLSYATVVTGLLAGLGWMTLRRTDENPTAAEDDQRTARQALREYLRLMRALRASVAPRPAARR